MQCTARWAHGSNVAWRASDDMALVFMHKNLHMVGKLPASIHCTTCSDRIISYTVVFRWCWRVNSTPYLCGASCLKQPKAPKLSDFNPRTQRHNKLLIQLSLFTVMPALQVLSWMRLWRVLGATTTPATTLAQDTTTPVIVCCKPTWCNTQQAGKS